MTSLPLSGQRLFAHFATSRRRSLASRLAAIIGRTEFPGWRELAGLRPATRFLIIGLIAWLGLAGLATMIAVVSVEMSTMSFSAWRSAPASAFPNSDIRSRAGFDNILQRPLFARSRQAVATAASAPPQPLPVMLDQNITLKGVLINGTLAKAFVISSQHPVGAWVQADEEVAGWRVVAVKPDRVLLGAGGEKLTIQLGVNSSAK
jgi:hypothetical protein